MNFELNNTIRMLNKYSNVDALYGPYNSFEDAVEATKNIADVGLTVGVRDGDVGIIEYWWKYTPDLTEGATNDERLVEKSEVLISTAEIIAAPKLKYGSVTNENINVTVKYNSKATGRINIYKNGILFKYETITPGTSVIIMDQATTLGEFEYRVEIVDLLGQIVPLENNVFLVKVGGISITQCNLQQILNRNVVVPGSTVPFNISVFNNSDPVNLYINGTLYAGVNMFNATPVSVTLDDVDVTADLDSNLNARHIIIRAVDASDTNEYSEIDVVYYLLDTTQHKIIIDSIESTDTAHSVRAYFHFYSGQQNQSRVRYYVDNVYVGETNQYFSPFVDSNSLIIPAQSAGEHTLKLEIDSSQSEEAEFIVIQYAEQSDIVNKSDIVFQFDADNIDKTEDNEYIWKDSHNYQLDLYGISEGVNGKVTDSDGSYVKFSGESYAVLKNANGVAINPYTLQSSTGYTLEFIYRTRCIGNLNAKVLSTLASQIDSQLGAEISYEKIRVSDGQTQSAMTLDVSENSWIHVTIVYANQGFYNSALTNQDLSDQIKRPYQYIYINGSMCSVKTYDPATASSQQPLVINIDPATQSFGECDVKCLRFYNTALSPTEVVSNYINSIDDETKKARVRAKNSKDLPVVTFRELSNAGYHFSDLLALVDKGLQKSTFVNCEVTYQESENDTNPQIWYAETRTQGTSTLQFPIKNFKIILFDTYDSATNKMSGTRNVSFKSDEGWAEESTFTLKCDYMEAAHLNNTPTCTFYNNIIDELVEDDYWSVDDVSPARQGYDKNGDRRQYTAVNEDGTTETKYGYLDAIKGFPCIVQYIDRAGETHYLGSYMFNLDKEANSLGFEAYVKDGDEYTESHCVSLEGTANTDGGAGSFFSFDYWVANESEEYYDTAYNRYYLDEDNEVDKPASVTNFESFKQYYLAHPDKNFYVKGNTKYKLISTNNSDTYYRADFETRHIYNKELEKDPQSWGLERIINWVSNSYDALQAATDQTRDSVIATIKEEFPDYFNVNYCLLYYLQMIVFGQVDNAGKNCMWDTWDGNVWFPRPYDLDTMAGLDNSGYETIPVDAEYNVRLTPAINQMQNEMLTGGVQTGYNDADLAHIRYNNTYNTSNSRFWILFATIFNPDTNSELLRLYTKLREHIYTTDNILSFYFANTSDIIGENYYNGDMVAKFIKVFEDSNGAKNYLQQLHGNRVERFKYWITNRLIFCDSLFKYNRTTNDLIKLRIHPNSDTPVIMKTYQPCYITIHVGSNTSSGLEGNMCFYCSPQSMYQDGFEGVKIIIPKVTGDKEVSIYGAHNIKEIGGIADLNCKEIHLDQASKLTYLDLTNVMSTSNLNVLEFGNNEYLQTFICMNQKALGNALNLTSANNIKEVNLTGSTISGITLTTATKGSTIKRLILNNTPITTLTLHNVPFLQTLDVTGCSRLQELILDSCQNLQTVAFNQLPSLKTLKLINCPSLEDVNITNMDTLEITGETIQNCPNVRRLNLSGITNIGGGILPIESLENLEELDVSYTTNITGISLYGGITSFKKLIAHSSQIQSLDLKNSNITNLDCHNCADLTNVINLSYEGSGFISNTDGIFTECYNLASISGNKLKITGSGNYLFRNCEKLRTLEFTTIDFTSCTTMVGSFALCHSLKWSECKKILDTCTNVTDFTNLFRRKYILATDEDQKTIPVNLFENCTKAANFSSTFSFIVPGSVYNVLHTPIANLTQATTVNKFTCTSTKFNYVTNITYMFGAMTLLSTVANDFMQAFPELTNASSAFYNTGIKTISNTFFSTNTKLTNLSGFLEYADLSNFSITNSSNLFYPLTNLTTIAGMFHSSKLTGTIPVGWLRNNKKLTTIRCFLAKTGITKLNPLFKSGDTYSEIPNLTDVRAAFYNTNVAGELPADLFVGANNITDAGAYNGASSSISNVRCWGLFSNTKLTTIPEAFFSTISKVTSIQGMFMGCTNAVFPSETDEQQYSMYKNFLAPLTKVTNLSYAFTGAQFNLPIQSGFIPNRNNVVNLDYMFAYTAITRIPDGLLSNLPKLDSARGLFKYCTLYNHLPAGMFQNDSSLRYLNGCFQECINLDGVIPADMFDGCTSITNLSSLFSNCFRLGNGSEQQTIPENLLADCLDLQTVDSMFKFCQSIKGKIPKLFTTDITANYSQLVNVDNMFSNACCDIDEDEFMFDPELFYQLKNVTSAKNTFYYANRYGYQRTSSKFKLQATNTLFQSPYLQNVDSIFSFSNIKDDIGGYLFRPALNSLQNIYRAFIGTSITSIDTQFLLNQNFGANTALRNVSQAFARCTALTTAVPNCKDKSSFTQVTVQNATGYVAGASAVAQEGYSGTWVSLSNVPSIAGGSSLQRDDYYTVTPYSKTSAIYTNIGLTL